MAIFRRDSSLPPPPVSKAKDTGPAAEVGVTGLKQSSGMITEEFDRRLQGAKARKIWREMGDNDAVAGSLLFLLRMYLRGCTWTVNPHTADNPDHEAKVEFVESCMEDMSHTWSQFVDDISTMFQYGWAWFEVVYKVRNGHQATPGDSSKYTDGAWGWRKFAFRSQDSLQRWHFDEAGGVDGWDQLVVGSQGKGTRFLQIEKALLFRTTTTKGNPEGRSVFRTAYLSWWFRKRMREIEAIAIERELNGLPVMKVPAKVLTDPTFATAKAAYETLVKDIRADEQAGVVIPSECDEHGNPLYVLELLSSTGSRAIDVGAVIQRYGREIAETVLADVILMGHENGGIGSSKALAVTKDEMLRRSLIAFARDCADVISRHEIPRLFALNGDLTGELPVLVAGAPDEAKVKDILEGLKLLADTGAPLWPSPELADWVEEKTGIPVPDMDDTDARFGDEIDDAA